MSTPQLNKILLNLTMLKSSLENFTMFVYCLKKQITFTTATAEQQDHKL